MVSSTHVVAWHLILWVLLGEVVHLTVVGGVVVLAVVVVGGSVVAVSVPVEGVVVFRLVIHGRNTPRGHGRRGSCHNTGIVASKGSQVTVALEVLYLGRLFLHGRWYWSRWRRDVGRRHDIGRCRYGRWSHGGWNGWDGRLFAGFCLCRQGCPVRFVLQRLLSTFSSAVFEPYL